MAKRETTQLKRGAPRPTDEQRDLESRIAETTRRAQGFRGAYEALIEPLINATIKLSKAENEEQNQRAHAAALEAQLADTHARLRETHAQLAGTYAQLADMNTQLADRNAQLRDAQEQLTEAQAALALTEEKRDLLAQELQSVYASHSWRITEPLRRAVIASRQWRLGASAFFATTRRHVGAAATTGSRIATEARSRATGALQRHRAAITGERLFGLITRWAGAWRLSWSRPRTMWGVTPILTLPLLARCDRLLGFRSDSLVFDVYYTTNSFDINLKPLKDALYRRIPRWISRFHKTVLHLALIRYDVFHTFCDRGLLPASGGLQIEPAEMEAIRRHGRRLYAYTYGADVRTRQATLALGHYNLCAECPEPGRFCTCDDERGARNIAAVQRHATALISMGDMLAYAPAALNIHYWPIDTAKFANTGVDWSSDRPLRIGHAPNHGHFKGTRYLVGSIEHLRARGYPIELVSVSGVANSEVIALFRSCDIVADQFIAGFHGYTALEAMALGKPVLCYLRDTEAVIDPSTCPIINCSPDTLEEILRRCLAGDFDLAEIGRRSRSYIEHYYSLEAVAIRLGHLYLDTAGFPDRINRILARRVSALEAQLPPLSLGAPPVPWDLVERADQPLRPPVEMAAR
jgi:hypothetical protein